MSILQTTLLFALFVVSPLVNSQNAYLRKSIDKPDGTVKEYYTIGGMSAKYEVIDGTIHGERKTFYKTGKLLSIESYDQGALHGRCIGFNRKGDTTSIQIYKHDTLLFFKQFIYHNNRELKETNAATFIDDSTLKMNPFAISSGLFYAKLSHEDVLESTSNTSTMKQFYRNGRIKSEAHFLNDDRHGYDAKYYRLGGIKYDMEFANDKLNGVYREYFRLGGVQNDWYYVNDELEGTAREYFKSGGIRYEWNYANNELEGEYKEYDEDGNLVDQASYVNGEIVE